MAGVTFQETTLQQAGKQTAKYSLIQRPRQIYVPVMCSQVAAA
jgi:hypothetical protein